MNKRAAVTATLVFLLFSSFVSAVHADGGISGVNPAEGTVGTEVTISGSGFGEKRGQVLIGPEKCKALAWSDSEITCEVVKPLPAGEYSLTVLLQGDRKPAEPMTFSTFAMREPQIIPANTPSGLISDGESVTILGDFFGDKKGEVFVVEPSGETVTAKVVDWSMKAIRFEIPPKLTGATGTYVIKVENEVGDALRFVYVSSGMPGHMQDYAYIGAESNDNASGVEYKDEFYVFHTHSYCVFCSDYKRIKLQTIDYGGYGYEISVSGEDNSIPEGETDASVVPLVIEGKMWVFHTGTNHGLYYTTFDGATWGNDWYRIRDLSTEETWEIAPVYNTVRRRIEVYYENYRKLKWVYSDNYGSTWAEGGEVQGVGSISTPPSAVFYKKSDTNYMTLLAVGDGSNQGHVFDIKDGAVVATRLSFGTVYGRPFIYEPVYLHNEFHLIWLEADNSDVLWKDMYRWRNDEWGETYYHECGGTDWCWKSDWAPNLAAWYPEGYHGLFEYQFWGYDGHWALNAVGLPLEP